MTTLLAECTLRAVNSYERSVRRPQSAFSPSKNKVFEHKSEEKEEEMEEDTYVTVLFVINNKTMKIRVKTKDARKQLRIGQFKQFVFTKCKQFFSDELDNYVWKVYNKDLKKYLWANDNVLISDNDKVMAAIKETMTMLVINPKISSRDGSDEAMNRYEVEIKERRPAKKSEPSSASPKINPEPSPVKNETTGVSPLRHSQIKQHLINLVKSRCSDATKQEKSASPTNSVMMETPTCSPKSNGASESPGKHIDIKPLLISLVKKYNQEFQWIAKNSGASKFEDENFDGVWDLISCEMNTKLSFSSHEYTYEECKEQFGLLLNLYVSIIGMKNAKRIDDWQFFKIFHTELDLTPFDGKINELKAKFDEVSAVERKI